ncbi:MAG TPA: glycosyltransferase family A protein [Solirubrobacteraceae bacterium]|nr:glycosyltransferase family A protein [Solirubrobacteraceae bacterium]
MSDPTGSAPSYTVVSPVRDEARFLATTARSLVAQTLRPRHWVIVDDGSTDATPELAERLAAAHDWITVVHRPRRVTRERGAPIVRAFNDGLSHVERPGDVVVKLDGDLHLPAHYFEWVLAVFAREPRAGIVGGTVYVPEGDRWVPDAVGRHTVHGAIKSYRRQCLEEIGGLRESMGWDGIDEYAARSRGWRVLPLSELGVLHYKPRGSKQHWRRARWEEGRGARYMGYRWHGIVLRVAYRSVREHPPVLAGLTLGTGYLWATVRRLPQCDDRRAVDLLREEQAARLWRLLRGGGDVQPDRLEGGGPAFWTLDSPLPGERAAP